MNQRAELVKIYYEGGGNKEYAFFNKSINYETIFCVGVNTVGGNTVGGNTGGGFTVGGNTVGGNTVGGVLAGVETQLAA